MERKMMLKESVTTSLKRDAKRFRDGLVVKFLRFTLDDDANILLEKWGMNDETK